MDLELDKRILKTPLSGFDKDEAKKCLYLSKKGYFGNYVEDFEDISKLPFGTLGACEFRLNELFEEYELLDSENKYIPFGVKK